MMTVAIVYAELLALLGVPLRKSAFRFPTAALLITTAANALL